MPRRGADRRRERGADHPGPRLATAAVVPVVPIIDSREAGAHRAAPSCRAVVPIDGGKLVPVMPCPSSRATAWQAGAAPVPRRAVVSIDAGKVVPIDCGKVMPIMPRRRADHRPCRGAVRRADRQPGRSCPSSGATAWQRPRWCPWCPSCRSSTAGKLVPIVPRCRSTAGRSCPSCRAAVSIIQGHGLATAAVVPVVSVMPIIDGGKVVPIIQGHGSQRPRWCPSCRSTAGKVVPVVPRCRSTAGRSCPSSRATAWQRPRWCPWFPSCPSSTVGRSCRRADGGKLVPIIQGHNLASWCRAGPPSCRRVDRRRQGGADRRRGGRAHHPGPRPGNGRGGARGFRHADHRQPGRWCPSCRAAVPIIDSREGRADHPGPRPGKLVPRRSPVMPSCRAAGRCPGRSCRSTAGRWCPSSRATARNGRGGARRAHHRQPGRSCRATVPTC